MALLGKTEISRALTRLGELALQDDQTLQLIAVGGAVMVLAYNIRPMTHDVDVLIIAPPEARDVVSLLNK